MLMLTLMSRRFTRTLSYAYACVVRVNQPLPFPDQIFQITKIATSSYTIPTLYVTVTDKTVSFA